MIQYLQTPPYGVERMGWDRWPNIYEKPLAASWELKTRLGLDESQIPEAVGAAVLLFGVYEEAVHIDGGKFKFPVTVHAWTSAPKDITTEDGGLGIRHLAISSGMFLENTSADFPVPKVNAWLWPVEQMQDEVFGAALLRHPQSARRMSILSEATDLNSRSNLQEWTCFVPETVKPDTDLVMISGGEMQLVTREQIKKGALSWVGTVGETALQNS